MTGTLTRICILVALLTCSLQAAQSPPDTAQKPPASVTVTIGDTAAPPEWHLNVPVAATVQPDTQVGRLALLVVYPANVLAFGSVRATDTLKKAGFEVTAGPAKISGDTASVPLEFNPTGKESATLPSGTVAIVEFKVDKDAPEKTWRMTAEEIRAWGPPPAAQELTVAYKGPASLLVTPPGLPILACFFYMH